MPPSAELGEVLIADTEREQRLRQRLDVELRVVARARNGSDIHDRLHGSLAQQGGELLERAGRVADGVNAASAGGAAHGSPRAARSPVRYSLPSAVRSSLSVRSASGSASSLSRGIGLPLRSDNP